MKITPVFKETGQKDVVCCMTECKGLELNIKTKEIKLIVSDPKPEIKTVESLDPARTIDDLGLPARISNLLKQFKTANEFPEDLTKIKGIGKKSAEIIKKAL